MNDHHNGAEEAEGSDRTGTASGPVETEGLRISRDLVYGQARVHIHSQPQDRELTLDLYQPSDCQPGDRRPALVMAFGGAFHRGDKRQRRRGRVGRAQADERAATKIADRRFPRPALSPLARGLALGAQPDPFARARRSERKHVGVGGTRLLDDADQNSAFAAALDHAPSTGISR